MTITSDFGPGHVGPHEIAEKTRTLIITLTFLYTISLALVILRFTAKRHYGGTTGTGYGLEDWTSLAAFVCLTAYYGETMYIAVNCYAGWHASQLYLWQIEKFLHYVYANNVCYAFTLPMVKLSILATYNRLFSVDRNFQRVTIAVAAIVVGWMISVTLVQIFTCNPIPGAWLQTITKKCIDQTAFYYGNAISNVITDFILLIMPMPMIWKLNMSTSKKVNVTMLFILGGFVCIASILRIISFSQLDWTDITYTLVNVAQWTATETPLAYICASLPVLPLIIKTCTQRTPKGSQASSKYGHSNRYKDIEMNDEIPLNSVRVRISSPNPI